ncbi:LEM domain-containing protein [Wuchereria bancrofti]|uniref:LEM domain-containing protein n=1 Tax=Wuchereria bancrofti TaxID=6293 RepID=J9FJA7_WUCBA|nr:LEM domain-containing protein [Wuchereria bancrofti]
MSAPVRKFSSTRRSSKSPSRIFQKPPALSDEELRASLIALGAKVGPITATTRTIYEKQLEKRLQNNKSSETFSRAPDDLTPVPDGRKLPTPPRPTMVPRFHPSYSASSSSYIPRSVNDRSGTFEGIYSTSNQRRARRRLDFNDSQEKLNFSRKVEDYNNDSDDDHMESSRVVPPSPILMSDTQKSSSILSVLNKYLKFIRPRKSFPNSTKDSHSFDGRYPYSVREAAPTRSASLGFDISRVILFSLVSLFGFLLIAYLATANSGVLIHSGRIAYVAAKDTVFFLYTYAILPLLTLVIICGIMIGIYMLRLYQTKKKAEDKQRIFDLIEKITDIIRDANEQGQAYIAEPHVRDMLLPPSKRMNNSPEWRRWQEAVRFINLNESRVSTEARIINGVECSVWRWIPAKKNGWQGSAFDGSMRRSMLSQAPSHCLKLRGMFSSAKDYETKFMYLKEALLQKIAPVKPIHVYVEKDSKEGVMFARFASLTDCSCAFKSLHGTWFNARATQFEMSQLKVFKITVSRRLLKIIQCCCIVLKSCSVD